MAEAPDNDEEAVAALSLVHLRVQPGQRDQSTVLRVPPVPPESRVEFERQTLEGRRASRRRPDDDGEVAAEKPRDSNLMVAPVDMTDARKAETGLFLFVQHVDFHRRKQDRVEWDATPGAQKEGVCRQLWTVTSQVMRDEWVRRATTHLAPDEMVRLQTPASDAPVEPGFIAFAAFASLCYSTNTVPRRSVGGMRPYRDIWANKSEGQQKCQIDTQWSRLTTSQRVMWAHRVTAGPEFCASSLLNVASGERAFRVHVTHHQKVRDADAWAGMSDTQQDAILTREWELLGAYGQREWVRRATTAPLPNEPTLVIRPTDIPHTITSGESLLAVYVFHSFANLYSVYGPIPADWTTKTDVERLAVVERLWSTTVPMHDRSVWIGRAVDGMAGPPTLFTRGDPGGFRLFADETIMLNTQALPGAASTWNLSSIAEKRQILLGRWAGMTPNAQGRYTRKSTASVPAASGRMPAVPPPVPAQAFGARERAILGQYPKLGQGAFCMDRMSHHGRWSQLSAGQKAVIHANLDGQWAAMPIAAQQGWNRIGVDQYVQNNRTIEYDLPEIRPTNPSLFTAPSAPAAPWTDRDIAAGKAAFDIHISTCLGYTEVPVGAISPAQAMAAMAPEQKIAARERAWNLLGSLGRGDWIHRATTPVGRGDLLIDAQPALTVTPTGRVIVGLHLFAIYARYMDHQPPVGRPIPHSWDEMLPAERLIHGSWRELDDLDREKWALRAIGRVRSVRDESVAVFSTEHEYAVFRVFADRTIETNSTAPGWQQVSDEERLTLLKDGWRTVSAADQREYGRPRITPTGLVCTGISVPRKPPIGFAERVRRERSVNVSGHVLSIAHGVCSAAMEFACMTPREQAVSIQQDWDSLKQPERASITCAENICAQLRAVRKYGYARVQVGIERFAADVEAGGVNDSIPAFRGLCCTSRDFSTTGAREKKQLIVMDWWNLGDDLRAVYIGVES